MDLAYTITKHIHVWCVTISFALFVLRAVWHAAGSELLSRKLIRVAPHIVDTLLLLSGVILVTTLNYAQNIPHWLVAKLLIIVFYIALGFIGFKVKRSFKLMIPLAVSCFFTAAYLAINKPWL